MKKKHYKIHLIEVSEKELSEAPVIVRKVYAALKNNEPVSNADKAIAVKFTDYFRLEEVKVRTFSQAFKRVSNVKQAIAIEKKKVEKRMARKLKPGEIRIEGTAGPESSKALGDLSKNLG